MHTLITGVKQVIRKRGSQTLITGAKGVQTLVTGVKEVHRSLLQV